jgi:hypothetical protein
MTPWPILLITVALSQSAAAPAVQSSDDKAAIVQALLDYAEGYYGGEPARMTRAVSPYLTKREFRRTTPPLIGEMNADTLIEYSYGVKLAPEGRKMTTEVLDVGAETASARVFSAQFNDYAHLIKRNGAWQILDVLWHAPPQAASSDETAAVNQAVRAFAAAMTGSGGPDALSVLHPLAHIRVLRRGNQGRPRTIADQNAEALIAGLARGAGKLPGTIEDAQITVESIDTDVASARIVLGATRIYLHLALQEGRWRVVTVLNWTAAPVTAASR